jgi:hypothetical protein
MISMLPSFFNEITRGNVAASIREVITPQSNLKNPQRRLEFFLRLLRGVLTSSVSPYSITSFGVVKVVRFPASIGFIGKSKPLHSKE